jgi:hypothetical protein
MKAILLTTLFLSIFAFQSTAPDTRGAWRMTKGDETIMLLVADNYFMQTAYTPTKYIRTRGGTWKQEGNKVTLKLEFDTEDSTRVGQQQTLDLASGNGQLAIIGAGEQQVLTRVDDGTETPLAGLWRITGRANDQGVVTTMQRGARKTLKMITGTRFQWAAINPETRQFSGTGGGTYTLKEDGPTNRKYTETIEFFSRDNSRVGKSLTFDNKLTGNDWFHSGLSSTGGKVSEVWSRER